MMENKWDEADIADLEERARAHSRTRARARTHACTQEVKTTNDVYLYLKHVWAPALFPMIADPEKYPGNILVMQHISYGILVMAY